MHATSPDQTGRLATPGGLDRDLRQDLASAAWLMAAVTIPGLILMAILVS